MYLRALPCSYLLIASINFVNLTVARSLKEPRRSHRKAIGGGTPATPLQFLSESYLLRRAGVFAGPAAGRVQSPLFNELSGKAWRFPTCWTWVWYWLTSASFCSPACWRLLPGAGMSGFDPVQTLYHRFQLRASITCKRAWWYCNLPSPSFLIVATLTVSAQFDYLTTKDLGYDDQHVISVFKFGLSHQQAKLLREELLEEPAILEVAAKNEGRTTAVAKVNGDTDLQFDWETIDEDYLSLFRIPVVQGRNFSPDFPSDSAQSVLVNETFVKKAGWKEPIGQVVYLLDLNKKYTVAGVVKDHHYLSLAQEIGPQLFSMKPFDPGSLTLVRIKPGTETASLKHIEKTFRVLFPMASYFYQFKDEQNRLNYEAEARWKQIVSFGALLTIFISSIGLFGLATLSAERRTKEIGIRKVMGSSVTGLVRLLTWDFIKLVGASFLFAFPTSWFVLHKWLEGYPYRTPLSGWLFVLTALLTIGIALFTVGFQSIKAALTNPARSLKSE
jgi:uncharacterized membrane protein YkgB